MAKPKTIKLKNGQVTLSLMSTEDMAPYEAALKIVDGAVTTDMNQIALGLNVNPVTKLWELSTVKFNSSTLESKIESVKELTGSKKWAVVALMKALEDLQLV
jgi:hypothetical protein